MKKLTKWLRWVDDNLIHLSFITFIVLTSLFPKLPFRHVEYTYIKIRYDDIFPAVVGLVFLIQFLRRKVRLNTKFLLLVVLFWASVFISFLIGHYFLGTIPVFNIGLLHSLRRIQYMAIFFVASSIVTSEQRFKQYLKIYFAVLLLVSLYGIGQRFLQFPSIQSMNPAYVDGRLLRLNPDDRINSTFGGHFDLAAYLTFSIPILFGFYFLRNAKRYFIIFIVSLITLLYTAARSSFIAYIASISSMFIYFRKFKLYLFVLLITVGLMLITGEMTQRFQKTFQVKTIFVNEQTGEVDIKQKITTKELPAGGFKLPFDKLVKGKNGANPEDIELLALEKARQEAVSKGQSPYAKEVEKRAKEMAKFIKPERTILCDIACSTRLQIEWPRAIAAFMLSPIVGTGPSSITEATDNDFLRWLGETGLVGTLLFLYLLFSISRTVWSEAKKDPNQKYIYYGFVFGVTALLINALYVDVFEASKVAYNFWLIGGIYIGYITSKAVSKKINEKRKAK